MKSGIELITQERKEHTGKHGLNHDNEYTSGELRQLAIYCLTLKDEDYPSFNSYQKTIDLDNWFYKNVQDKKARMSEKEFQIEMLKIAGSLCAAQIDIFQNS